MDIQQLKYFAAVVRHQNFTRAAEEIHVSQPMLTRVIKQLEAELGAQLIYRTNKSFALTDAGEVLYRQANELLLCHQDLYRCVEDVKNAAVGEIRLSIPGVLLDIYFPQLLMRFRQQCPGINLSIIEEGSKLTAHSVCDGIVDLGLVMLPVENAPQLDIRLITRSACRLLVPDGHPFASCGSVSLHELQHERILTFSDTSTLHDVFLQLCAAQGFKPNIVYKSFMPNFIFEMVSYGQGVAVLPLPVIEKYIFPGLTSVPLTPHFPWEIAVIRKRGGYHTAAARRLLAFLCGCFAAGSPSASGR